MQQILAALVIIPKYETRPIERALIITAKAVPVTTTRITIMEKILIALEYKEGGKNRYYKLYQQ